MTDLREGKKMKLGFGLMRLPKLPSGKINAEETAAMTDAFMAAGGTYFDTAYVYDGGESEEVIRGALVERYPRESYTLATKLNAWLGSPDIEAAKRQIHISLERTGAGYFDYYLLHALQRNNYKVYDDYHLWDYVRDLKEKGVIRHYGFSFHADPELLEELLTLHPDVDMVQLQLNYADWENPGVAAKRNWEICRAHGKPVVVMEPVKGGILAEPIPAVRKILDAADTRQSYAAWAVRYAASKENILTVLSGMSSLAQMEDNLSYMKDFRPLSAEEEEVIKKAQKALEEDKSIPCTGCHYCAKGCPSEIPIPEIFTVANRRKGSPHFRTVREYNIVTQGHGRLSDCIECGQCEEACPQRLPVVSLLRELREVHHIEE